MKRSAGVLLGGLAIVVLALVWLRVSIYRYFDPPKYGQVTLVSGTQLVPHPRALPPQIARYIKLPTHMYVRQSSIAARRKASRDITHEELVVEGTSQQVSAWIRESLEGKGFQVQERDGEEFLELTARASREKEIRIHALITDSGEGIADPKDPELTSLSIFYTQYDAGGVTGKNQLVDSAASD